MPRVIETVFFKNKKIKTCTVGRTCIRTQVKLMWICTISMHHSGVCACKANWTRLLYNDLRPLQIGNMNACFNISIRFHFHYLIKACGTTKNWRRREIETIFEDCYLSYRSCLIIHLANWWQEDSIFKIEACVWWLGEWNFLCRSSLEHLGPQVVSS